jgi:hypothetical protein
MLSPVSSIQLTYLESIYLMYILILSSPLRLFNQAFSFMFFKQNAVRLILFARASYVSAFIQLEKQSSPPPHNA